MFNNILICKEMTNINSLLEDFRTIIRALEDLYHKFNTAALHKALPYYIIENPPHAEYSLDPFAPYIKPNLDRVLLGVIGYTAPLLEEDKMIVNFHIKADSAIDVLIALQRIALSKYKQTRSASAATRARLGQYFHCLTFHL